MKRWPRLTIPASAILLAASAVPALAHNGGALTDRTAWSSWEITPDIVIATALVAAIYIAGMVRRRTAAVPVPEWRHALFFGGLAAVFLSLQSPVDPIAERLFWMHQIQHLLLRMVGPMLIALSWPEGSLTAGLPAPVRRTVLAPVVSSKRVRTTFAFLSRPDVATVLFIAALYVWEIPALHNLALRDEAVHYAMHMTMLAAGLIFFWRVFDRRPPPSMADLDDGAARDRRRSSPHGLGYGARLMMLWAAVLSNIVLGAYTTLKTDVLYTAYDDAGRLFGFAPLADERLGGIVIWILSSMMALVAVLIVIHLWALRESELEQRYLVSPRSNSATLFYPTTGAALIERARPKNRAMAIGFSVFVATVFSTVILIGVLDTVTGVKGTRIEAGHELIQHAAHHPRAAILR